MTFGRNNNIESIKNKDKTIKNKKKKPIKLFLAFFLLKHMDEEKKTFDEVVAQRIIDLNGLSQTTMRVWKNRGKIPDRYFSPDFNFYQDYFISDDDTIAIKNEKLEVLEKIKKILSLKEIKLSIFNDSTTYFAKIYDFDKVLPSKSDIDNICLVINNLRLLAEDLSKAIFTLSSVKTKLKIFFGLIHQTKFLENNFTEHEITLVRGRITRKADLENWQIIKIKKIFADFAVSVRF